jgi:hypothetical protein
MRSGKLSGLMKRKRPLAARAAFQNRDLARFFDAKILVLIVLCNIRLARKILVERMTY